MPSKATRAKRAQLHASMVMLGFVFDRNEDRVLQRAKWRFSVPDHIERDNPKGWVKGYFNWRWEAVESAARQAGIIEQGSVLPWR